MNGSWLFLHYSRFLEKVSNIERERNSDKGEETTLELNDESSSECNETTEIDIVPSTRISRTILEEDRFRNLIENCT